MPRKDITSKLLELLYLEKKLSRNEIALRLHCNITTIFNKMRKFGIPARDRYETIRLAMEKFQIRIPRHQLKRLYVEEKRSLGEVARALHHDRATIERELKRHEISRRTNLEALALTAEKRKIKRSTLTTLYFTRHLTQEKIAKKLKRGRAYVIRLMKEYKLKARGPAYYHTRHKKYDFSKSEEEKAYLIGFRLGDLDVRLSPSRRIIKVGCTSTKSAQISLFNNLFSQYGRVWLSKRRKDKNYVMFIYLNRSFDFLLPKKDEIPRWIRGNEQYSLAFLAGYTDAEGCFWVSQYNPRFTLASYDKLILKQIWKGLSQLGVPCHPPKILVKQGHEKSNGMKYRKDHWYFSITKKSSLALIVRFLGSRLRHQKRLKDLKRVEQYLLTHP